MPGDLVRRTYDARAPYYDALVRLLSFGGDSEYRRRAVAALGLRKGDRVLDVGCGTGLNAPLLAAAVGPSGLVVGTDLSLRMLGRARPLDRLRRVQAEATQAVFKPGSFDAALCTYVVSTLLGARVLDPILDALRPGGRLVVADDTLPPGWFVGPGFMLRNLLRDGWPDLRGDTVRALRPRVEDLRVAHVHYGMIYIISARKASSV